jgi:hypothetical protein
MYQNNETIQIISLSFILPLENLTQMSLNVKNTASFDLEYNG